MRLYLQLFVGRLMSYLCYLCLFAYSAQWTGIQYILCCVFVLFVYPMFPFSLDYPFLIALSVFSNIYFIYFIPNDYYILPFTQVMPKCQYEYRNPVVTGNSYMCLSIAQALGSRIFFKKKFSILSIKCASTTYMNPFDMLRCEINALMNYAPFS